MVKERMLTVLVPIKDEDAVTVTALPPVSVENINIIYKHEGVYKRIWLNPSTNQYEYHVVVDREFPYLGKTLEIFDFTYDATRMGSAPTISAQGVMWFADKNENNEDVTLEDLWLARNDDCHVSFNGENFYLKQVPTSSKSNEDARYRYDLDFVSERVVLEDVYLYDVVQPFVTEKPISESSVFSFYGDINELAIRINASLLRSGLASLKMRPGVTACLTYEQFNSLGLGTFPYPDIWTQAQRTAFYNFVYVQNNGDYNQYLRHNVYEIEDGEFVQSGYVCKIGKDKKGELTTSEEKLITFDNNTIHEALQHFHDTFGLQYYISRETNEQGGFTGNTLIMIADCEHDFADVSNDDFVRDDDGIPTTEHPFDYGVDKELLSKEKTNTTDKIITRITGTGSEENIPWYYPNPTADGWLKPVYKRNGEIQTAIVVDYPKTEGSTPAEYVRYEKYLKNRIGNVIQYGIVKSIINELNFQEILQGFFYENNVRKGVYMSYAISTKSVYSPKITLNLDLRPGSNCTKFIAYLEEAPHTRIGAYDSSAQYESPTVFQSMCESRDGKTPMILQPNKVYYLYLYYYLSSVPNSMLYDRTGYLKPAVTVIDDTHEDYSDGNYFHNYSANPGKAYIGQNFYDNQDLVPYVVWRDDAQKIEYRQGTAYHHVYPVEAGYSLDGSLANAAKPIPRVKNYKYKDFDTNNVYLCETTDAAKIVNAKNQQGYSVNPEMSFEEWVSTFPKMAICVYEADGFYFNSKKIQLVDYGIRIQYKSPDIFDTIEFQRLKYVTPQAGLMPEVYIKTDGERRFYNAVNYPLSGGTPDDAIGEKEGVGQIINPLYYKEGTTTHYDFENEYTQLRPHEHIETFDDVKPSIKGQINTAGGQSFRIDVVEEFAYDELDSDEIWESSEDGNISGEYKHPYFFAKLRPLGFNIFDLALQEDMILSMTTGHCGACNFKIGVDENTKKNPVEIWEYNVYEGSDWNTKVFRYSEGSLRRYVDTTNLYYDKDGTASGYTPVDAVNIRSGFIVDATMAGIARRAKINRTVYSAEEVINGEVGALKKENRTHFAGDVKIGKIIGSQQDTTENYVWVALMKDVDTYGTIMPSAKADYTDNNFSVYIRPKSIADVHAPTSTPSEDEENADKFVLTNIRLPQVYLRNAEKELSKRLIAYMYGNNYQKFNFSIKFSRIFLAQNIDKEENLNENSVLYVTFNNRIYRQYVKHYTYKMTRGDVLPEISVDMNEELSVSRTHVEQESAQRLQIAASTNMLLHRSLALSEERMSKRTVGRSEDVIVSGNLVSRNAVTSFGDLRKVQRLVQNGLSNTQVDLEVNHFKRADFSIDNGTDLKIGSDIHLPTIYKDGKKLRRRAWDESAEEFVEVSNNDFKPAFLQENVHDKMYTINDADNVSMQASTKQIVDVIMHTVEKRFIDAQISKMKPTCGGSPLFPQRDISTITVDNVDYLFWTDENGNSLPYLGYGSIDRCQFDPFVEQT